MSNGNLSPQVAAARAANAGYAYLVSADPNQMSDSGAVFFPIVNEAEFNQSGRVSDELDIDGLILPPGMGWASEETVDFIGTIDEGAALLDLYGFKRIDVQQIT